MRSPSPAPPLPTPIGRHRAAPRSRGAVERGVSRRPSTLYQRFVKHTIDRVLAPLMLVALAPVLCCIAAMVRLALGPGVIYRQRRVGCNGEPFTIFKFRTMTPGPVAPLEILGPARWAEYQSADDPRHTPFGRWLRRSSLDELPQLLNVLRGEMSMVGPRPELVEIVEDFNLWDHPRHSVRPGITGHWQISPDRSACLHECVDMDSAYVADVSLRRDLHIIGGTVRALLHRTGQ